MRGFYSFTSIVLVFMVSTSKILSAESEFVEERIGEIPVFVDGPSMDGVGYNNCDMNRNGELNILKILKSNAIVFDVGANVGNWSLHAFNQEKSITVHCFEPAPPMYEKLQVKLKNHRAVFSMLALSDESGEAVFVYYPNNPGLSTFHRRHSDIEEMLKLDPVYFSVKTEKLDVYCKENHIPHINFLKIDTEGHEYAVLLGAEQRLKNNAIDSIQFEYGGCYLDSKTTLKEVYDYLGNFGYDIYRIIPNGLVHIEVWRPELENYQYSNYLAIKNT